MLSSSRQEAHTCSTQCRANHTRNQGPLALIVFLSALQILPWVLYELYRHIRSESFPRILHMLVQRNARGAAKTGQTQTEDAKS